VAPQPSGLRTSARDWRTTCHSRQLALPQGSGGVSCQRVWVSCHQGSGKRSRRDESRASPCDGAVLPASSALGGVSRSLGVRQPPKAVLINASERCSNPRPGPSETQLQQAPCSWLAAAPRAAEPSTAAALSYVTVFPRDSHTCESRVLRPDSSVLRAASKAVGASMSSEPWSGVSAKGYVQHH